MSQISHWFRRAATGTAAALLFAGAAQVTHAAAPQVKTQPGYYRVMLGDFEVTALSDGTVALPVDKLLTNTNPAQVGKSLSQSFLKAPVETSVNGYLINTGSKLVLVDTGAAGLFGPTLGNLVANLKAAGYQPEQVDAVLHHPHARRPRGRADGGRQTCVPQCHGSHADQARRRLLAQRRPIMDKAPAEDAKGFFKGAHGIAEPLRGGREVQALRWKHRPRSPASSAVRPRPATRRGTAPTSSRARARSCVLWGDLMHVAAVQFANPSVTIQFDTDSKAAAVQRKQAYAEAAKQGYLVGSAHLSFPGLGHLRTDGKGYTPSCRSTTTA